MIRLEGICRRWPEFALRDVSLEVAAGEYLVVVGPTGAGKTLLLELVLGIHAPDAGRVSFGGIDVTDWPPERRGIGMVYQDYALFPHLDVRRNLAFGLRYQRGSAAEHGARIVETAARLGIEPLLHRLPGTLSGGEQQRVAFGRALVTQPRVLLLDEPFSALDRTTAQRLRADLQALHKEHGLTIVHITHDLAEARQLGGRIALLHEGAVHGIGSAEQILRRPATLFAARFAGAVNVFAAALELRAGAMHAVLGPLQARASDAAAAHAHVLVQPDEVALLDAATPLATNVVFGEVVGLRDEPHHVAVSLEVAGLPEPLIVFVGRSAARGLHLGQCVAADLRHALHVFHDPA